MASCQVLDLRCIFVNELIGSMLLAVVIAAIFYFIFASKLRLGFDTTIAFAFPVLLLFGIAIGGLSVIMAFSTVVIGFMLAWIFNKFVGNR